MRTIFYTFSLSFRLNRAIVGTANNISVFVEHLMSYPNTVTSPFHDRGGTMLNVPHRVPTQQLSTALLAAGL